MGSLCGYQDSAAQTEREVLAVERASMDGWLKGDAGPMLAAADPDITLFHVMTAGRVEGIPAVKELYAAYGGRPLFDGYQIENPKVHAGVTQKWNATEVYQRKKGAWRVIHSHFSVNGLQP
jgi:hypothetical protein